MSVSSVPDPVKFALWGRAAGRCQYRGCNHALWKDDLTQYEFNVAYIAHIVADKPDGPRGDPIRSPLLAQDIANLMLMCDQHHRLIDRGDVAGHPEVLLLEMKAEHERRIELATAATADMQSEIIYYAANVGEHPAPVHFDDCVEAMRPLYPASSRGIGLGFGNSALTDGIAGYWAAEQAQLAAQFERRVRPRLFDGTLRHASVFALAPQPLLMTLGYLLSDLALVNVHQRRREPATWRWAETGGDILYRVDEPREPQGAPALVLSLSATITDDRVHAVLPNAAIWQFRIAQPHNDFLQTPLQLRAFRQALRPLFDRIKAVHGQGTHLHVFPAMPVAAAVEFGRVVMPKADLAMRIYDQQPGRGFVRALDLGSTPSPRVLAPLSTS